MLPNVTIELPLQTYNQLRFVAQQDNQSIPDMVAMLLADRHVEPRLPLDIEAELAMFPSLSTATLRLLAQPPLTREEQVELEQLHHIAQRSTSGLNTIESQREESLMAQYEHGLVRRATALSILQARGYKISEYLQLPVV